MRCLQSVGSRILGNIVRPPSFSCMMNFGKIILFITLDRKLRVADRFRKFPDLGPTMKKTIKIGYRI